MWQASATSTRPVSQSRRFALTTKGVQGGRTTAGTSAWWVLPAAQYQRATANRRGCSPAPSRDHCAESPSSANSADSQAPDPSPAAFRTTVPSSSKRSSWEPRTSGSSNCPPARFSFTGSTRTTRHRSSAPHTTASTSPSRRHRRMGRALAPPLFAEPPTVRKSPGSITPRSASFHRMIASAPAI